MYHEYLGHNCNNKRVNLKVMGKLLNQQTACTLIILKRAYKRANTLIYSNRLKTSQFIKKNNIKNEELEQNYLT